jgi:hypothetical protein
VIRRGILAVLVLAIGLAVPAATSAKDITKLFDRAVAKVTSDPDFADAVMLEADGTPDGHDAVDGAAQITNWRFVFDNQATEGSDSASVTIDWQRGKGFGKPDGNPSPFLEDLPIKRAPKMSLKKAITLLRDSGTQEFENVTLRRPLGPERTPPLYIFGVENGQFIAVNTKTGDVEPID